MKPLILIDEAEADVSDAYGFYLPRIEGLADRFLAAIREALVMVWSFARTRHNRSKSL